MEGLSTTPVIWLAGRGTALAAGVALLQRAHLLNLLRMFCVEVGGLAGILLEIKEQSLSLFSEVRETKGFEVVSTFLLRTERNSLFQGLLIGASVLPGLR